MTTDERTPWLADATISRASSPEEQNAEDVKIEARGGFELWQIAALCGILISYADTSFAWATHETIASNFDSLRHSSWLMTSFTVGYCVTLPLDSGIGQAYWQVILGRIIQGCGASGIISLASVIITDIAAPSDVAVLRSYVNIASTVGLSGGGPLGGFLAGKIGWRWSFLGQVPIAIGCCIFLAYSLRPSLNRLSKEHEGQDGEGEDHQKEGLRTFDFPGAIALAIWVTSFLAVIDLQSQLSWGHPLLLGILIISVLAFVAFLAAETYPGNRELLIPLRLLKTEVGAFCLAQLLIIGGCHGFVSQMAAYFSNTQGASDMEGGLSAVPSSVGNAIGSLIAGQIIRRSGRYKKLCLVSIACCILTELLVLLRWSHSTSIWESLVTFPFGIFGGIILSTQFIGLYQCTAKHQMATAITTYYMSQQVGIALGISLVSALMKQEFHTILQKTLVDIPNYQEVGRTLINYLEKVKYLMPNPSLQIIKQMLKDSSVVGNLPTHVRDLVSQSYFQSFWVVPAFAISTQVLAILPMVFTTEK
ncbi:hypothetical protein VTL71DRAFT_1662 [Oculimacula yallundae]|uniref:Major facilitator superfamily (MFS) profile domain-containing protein n=1 Tax=Oculimacula yallundae TaxID=86028 RepID=A0ABR4CDR1_9HELO